MQTNTIILSMMFSPALNHLYKSTKDDANVGDPDEDLDDSQNLGQIRLLKNT